MWEMAAPFPPSFRTSNFEFLTSKVVEMSGFEPLTPCLQGRCSPSELHPRFLDVRRFEVRPSFVEGNGCAISFL